jgi:hypothetical protein
MVRATTSGWSLRRLLIVALAVIAVVLIAAVAVRNATKPRRTTPVYEPPVLAGQVLWGPCSGGFYARLGSRVVLTSTGHCTSEGTIATDPDGAGVRGVFGPRAEDASCPYPNHSCASSDINYLVVAPDRIPWGHLDQVDLGTGGYRTIPPAERPLGCDDISIGDAVEINGRDVFRTGRVVSKGQNLNDQDGVFFPCMIISDIQVSSGDSGGAVLVRRIPAGVTSRSFGGSLGFTPLAEGLAQLGLELCTSPNCDLAPPR